MPDKDHDTTDDATSSTPVDSQRRNLLAGAAGVGVAAGLFTPAAAQTKSSVDRSSEFAGQTAFVTGGARGIGYSCAEVLAQAGANIVLYDVAQQIDQVRYPLATRKDLNEAQTKIQALGSRCTAVQGDVRDGATLKAAMDQAAAEYGSIDMLIVNAGIVHAGPLEQHSEAEISVVLDVNLVGAINTMQAAIPYMRRQNSGRIVAVSSILGRSGSANFPVYSAAKWGVIGLVKSVAKTLGKSNVTCNAVCPSLVRTKLVDNEYFYQALELSEPYKETLDAVARSAHALPIGFIEPVHVANAVKFICSDAATVISGDVFDIAAGSNADFPA